MIGDPLATFLLLGMGAQPEHGRRKFAAGQAWELRETVAVFRN
jgi:hypothetical protein